MAYLESVDKKLNIRFQMSNYLKHETTNKIFLKLENMFKLNRKELTK